MDVIFIHAGIKFKWKGPQKFPTQEPSNAKLWLYLCSWPDLPFQQIVD